MKLTIVSSYGGEQDVLNPRCTTLSSKVARQASVQSGIDELEELALVFPACPTEQCVLLTATRSPKEVRVRLKLKDIPERP